MDKKAEWFSNWFNSSYYHRLYKNRDIQEAQAFIDKLLAYLCPPKKSKVLDLACGRGRYAKYMFDKGLLVEGWDISSESIAYAQQYEEVGLHFRIHDMRESFDTSSFDYIFSFFTSFGYFETDEEHLATIHNIYTALESNGIFVLDFLNAQKVINQLVEEEEKKVDGTLFKIKRTFENGYILKHIYFIDDEGNPRFYTEKVRAFSLESFKELFGQVGFKGVQVFGDYNLSNYQEDQSDRLILILTK